MTRDPHNRQRRQSEYELDLARRARRKAIWRRVRPWLLLIACIAALAWLASCSRAPSWLPFNLGARGTTKTEVTATAGEATTYWALSKMALGSFTAGVLCLIGGTIATAFMPVLRVLTSIGITLIVVGLGTAAACLLLDRYGGWTAAILLLTLAGAAGMWLLNRWRESGWEARVRNKIAARRANGDHTGAAALEEAMAT